MTGSPARAFGDTLAAQLEIRSARYETLDGSKGADVTARLKALARDGGLSVMADNDALGGDPALNQVKQLRAAYVLNGQPGEIIVAENQPLNLGNTSAVGEAPAFAIVAGQDGAAALRAFAPGTVALRTAAGRQLQTEIRDVPEPATLPGGWQLNFPPAWGAPDSVMLDQLISWTEHTNPGVKYFSGTATYEKDIEIPPPTSRPDANSGSTSAR